MQDTFKKRVEEQINCKQHKTIVFDIFKNTPVIEHDNLCDYLEKCYKSYNENRNLMRKEKLVFEDFFKVYSHEHKKFIIVPSLDGLEKFGDDVYKKITENNANKMINRTLSNKYREMLTPKSKSLFVEMSLAGISVDTVRKEFGRKIAAIKTPEEFETQAERLLEHYSKWDRSIIEERIFKHHLVEGVDYDLFFDNGFNSISLKIHTFKASQAFGSIMWCITRTNAMFRNYRREGSDYIFIFNFSLPITDDLSLVAVLTDLNSNVNSIFNKKDIRLNHLEYQNKIYNNFNPLAILEGEGSKVNLEEQNKKAKTIAHFVECNNRSQLKTENVFFENAFNNPFFFKEKFGEKIDLNNNNHVSIVGIRIKKLDLVIDSDFIEKNKQFISYTEEKDFHLIENKAFLKRINKDSVFNSPLNDYSYNDDFIVENLENGNIDFLNSGQILVGKAIEHGHSKLANYILRNKKQIKEENRVSFCENAFFSIEKLEPNMDKKIGFDFINKIIPEDKHKDVFDNYFNSYYKNKTNLPLISTIKKAYHLKFEKIEFCESKFQFKNASISTNLENISVYFELYKFSKPESIKLFLALTFRQFLKVNDFLKDEKVSKDNNNNLLNYNFFTDAHRFFISKASYDFLMAKFSMFQSCIIDKLLKEYPEHKQQIWEFIEKYDILFLTVRNSLLLCDNFTDIQHSLKPLVNLSTKHKQIDKIKVIKKRLKKFKKDNVQEEAFFYYNKKEPQKVLYKELIEFINKI